MNALYLLFQYFVNKPVLLYCRKTLESIAGDGNSIKCAATTWTDIGLCLHLYSMHERTRHILHGKLGWLKPVRQFSVDVLLSLAQIPRCAVSPTKCRREVHHISWSNMHKTPASK